MKINLIKLKSIWVIFISNIKSCEVFKILLTTNIVNLINNKGKPDKINSHLNQNNLIIL